MTDRTRRDFVRIAAATTAAVGLAGCSDSSDSGGETDAMDESLTETDSEMDGMSETDDGTAGMTETDDDMSGMTETDDDMGGMTETDDDMGGMTETMGPVEAFEVTVTNVSEPGTITTSDGDDVAVPLSPTAYAVHSPDVSAFSEGESASGGLESLAEDGDPSTLGESLSMVEGVETADAVATPDGAEEAGPLGPGASYTFEVEAGPGRHLTLATMFVQSNDLFYAPEPEGMALFDDGDPVSGDVTDRLVLWDAGTEQNQEPGAGPDQAPRQSGADTGPEEDATVRPVSEVMDEYSYPERSEVIEVTVTPSMN
jgi:hypothetical protein